MHGWMQGSESNWEEIAVWLIENGGNRLLQAAETEIWI